MPAKYEYKISTSAYGYKYHSQLLNYSWNRSPVVNGAVMLQANVMYRAENKVRTLRVYGRHSGNTDRQAIYGATRLHGNPYNDYWFTTSVVNASYAKLKNRIRGDDAALGVSLSQWRQSWTMIALRGGQLRKIASRAEREAKRINKRRKAQRARIARHRSRYKKYPKGYRRGDYLPVGSANVFLEYAFGWTPLLADIHSALKALTGDLPRHFVHASSTSIKTLGKSPSDVSTMEACQLKLRVTQACFVEVKNPNVWLLNKLGLINPALVVWDLIPWSFAVGWFGNFQAILGSFSDFYGLTISNSSTTYKYTYSEASTLEMGGKPGDFYYMGEDRVFYDTVKYRTLHLTLPSFQPRLPGLEFGLALTQTSLAVQQISRMDFFKNVTFPRKK